MQQEELVAVRAEPAAEEHASTSPVHGLWALTNRELKKWYKVPMLLFFSLIQPVIWLTLYGTGMNFGTLFAKGISIPGVPPSEVASLSSQFMLNVFGVSNYFSFLAVGMLSFIVLFTAMFSGMSVVWDRRFGFLDKVLSTPVSRGAIIMAKVFSSVVRSLAQAAIVLVIAVLMDMDTSHFSVVGIAGTFAALFLMTLGLSSIFVMLALRSSDWQTQMAIMNLLNLPLLFASNALFPAKFMPAALQYVVRLNPISYGTDIGRQLLLGAPGLNTLAFDFSFLAGFAVVFSAIGVVLSWRYLTR
ncbi:MAG: ABC transporter permease [Nitrososphaerota archaeon]|nr:ABC transporter permease [Nitrososphaerota archaeon]MDG6939823.1 ABC transporter permease [Nitrososphaerota archaeon]